MQIPALLAGFISPVSCENAWGVFEGEVDGMINMVYEVGPIPVKAVPKSVEFNQNYGKRWGEKADQGIEVACHRAIQPRAGG